jgi:hypothetical protein
LTEATAFFIRLAGEIHEMNADMTAPRLSWRRSGSLLSIKLTPAMR